MVARDISEYTTLIRRFLDRSITAAEFEREYLDIFKTDPGGRPDDQFFILDELFWAVDSFVGDLPIEDPQFDIDENQLRVYSRAALDKLLAQQEGTHRGGLPASNSNSDESNQDSPRT